MIFGNSSSTNATGTTDLPSVYFIKHSDKNIRNLDRLAKEIAENSPFSRLETNCGSYYGSMDRCQWIFFSIYSIEPRVIFSPSTSRDLRALRAHEEKKVKEFSLFSIHFGSHRRVSSADYARRRFTATRSIDRIPCESIVEMIGVTREPDDGPVLSGTFALCVALSCNTSAQPDFTGGEFRQRQWGTWVSTFRRSSICITLGKERNERVGRADRDLSLPLCLPFANRTMGLAICNPCKPLFFSGRISFRIATGEMLYTILGSNL